MKGGIPNEASLFIWVVFIALIASVRKAQSRSQERNVKSRKGLPNNRSGRDAVSMCLDANADIVPRQILRYQLAADFEGLLAASRGIPNRRDRNVRVIPPCEYHILQCRLTDSRSVYHNVDVDVRYMGSVRGRVRNVDKGSQLESCCRCAKNTDTPNLWIKMTEGVLGNRLPEQVRTFYWDPPLGGNILEYQLAENGADLDVHRRIDVQRHLLSFKD
jgi:hypothetical protein